VLAWMSSIRRRVTGPTVDGDMNTLLDTAEMDRFDQRALRQRLSLWMRALRNGNAHSIPLHDAEQVGPPLISVCICTFNRADLLPEAIECILCAGEPGVRFEIIIVDNNSTDHTRDVVHGVIRQAANIRYVFEPEQGLARARNAAVKAAQGQYVAFVDDECRVPAQWLEIAAEIIAQSSPAVFGGPYDALYEELPPAWMRPEYYSSPRHVSQRQVLPADTYIPGGNMFWRTEIIRKIGCFDEDLGVTGNVLAVGEETAAQLKLRRNVHDAVMIFDPLLAVGHLVRSEKMQWSWIVRHRFKSGMSNARIFGSACRQSKISISARILARLTLLTWTLTVGNLLRDRKRFPFAGGFVFERVMPHVVALGSDGGRMFGGLPDHE